MEKIDKLFIKNMVCHRCKIMVGRILKMNNIEATQIDLGEVELKNPINEEQLLVVKVN